MIDGRGGDDIILGGDGTEWVYGGHGADTIHGGGGDDRIGGGPGVDTIHPGPGTDTVYATDRQDAVVDDPGGFELELAPEVASAGGAPVAGDDWLWAEHPRRRRSKCSRTTMIPTGISTPPRCGSARLLRRALLRS